MKRFFEIYNSIMSYIGIVCLLGFILSVLVQVIARNFLPYSPAWTEEAAKYLFIFMVAFGCSVAVHKREFVGVDLIIEKFPEKVKMIVYLAIDIVLFMFSIFVLLVSVNKFAFIKFRMVSTAMQIPMQYIYFSIVILFSMLAFSFLLEIIDVIFFSGEDIQNPEVI